MGERQKKKNLNLLLVNPLSLIISASSSLVGGLLLGAGLRTTPPLAQPTSGGGAPLIGTLIFNF